MANPSGLTEFNLTVHEIIEEAFDLIQGDFVGGVDARNARRSLNLLLIDLQNRGHPLGKLEQVTLSMSTGDRTQVLEEGIIDVLHMVRRRNGIDTEMKRVSLFEDNAIAVKDQLAPPTQYTIDRNTTAAKLMVWPTPDNSTDTFETWVVRKIDDVTNSRQGVDLSSRFQPAITFGLAYFLSFKAKNVAPEVRAELKREYEEMLENAFEEDRERASFMLQPGVNNPILYR